MLSQLRCVQKKHLQKAEPIPGYTGPSAASPCVKQCVPGEERGWHWMLDSATCLLGDPSQPLVATAHQLAQLAAHSIIMHHKL